MRRRPTRIVITAPTIKVTRRTLVRDEDHRHTGRHEIVHWLYAPAELGRMDCRVHFPLLHRIHLIPRRCLDAACDRYDRRHTRPGAEGEPSR